MSLFVDNTKRSADELLADLASCRQFRHLNEHHRIGALKDTYLRMAECWIGPKAIKHPDPNKICVKCGTPRSKFSAGSGLCYRCYAYKGIEERDLWAEDVFAHAVGLFGFSCDACDEISKPEEHELRAAANRMLDGMEGAVKPVLCPDCTRDFKAYTSRRYGRGAWRTSPARDVEKMALAWFAQKVKVLAERVKKAA